jgi:hypothetical protein
MKLAIVDDEVDVRIAIDGLLPALGAPAPEAPALHKPFDEETLMAALSHAVNASSTWGR